MSRLLPSKALRLGGFSLVQTMIAMGMTATLLAAAYSSFTGLIGSMKASESYSVGQLMAVDYLTMDLRRCQDFPAFTSLSTVDPVSGKTIVTLTLPLTLQLPQFYKANGQDPNPPQRTLVATAATKHGKKDHKIFSSRYYTYYGTLGTTVKVEYKLTNGVLTRTETPPGKAALPPRAIGSNIATVTFGPSVAAIAADPVVTTTVLFRAKPLGWQGQWRAAQAPPPLSSTTFMREYYYSDF